MSTTASADFICSKCRKGYTWYAEFAGKVARCTCGAVIQFPHTDPKPKDPLAIAFLPRTIEEKSNGTAPMELPKDDLDPKILAERRALGEFFDDDVPMPVDQVRDVHVPFALLAIGLLLVSWQIADLIEGKSYGGLVVVGYVIVKLIELGLSLLGVMAAGKLMGIYFGRPKIAFFKLSALQIAPAAIGAMITAAMGDEAVGQVVGIGSFILLYWGLFSFIFQIKAWQTLVCVACVLLVEVLAAVLIAGAVLSIFVARGMH